MTELDIVLLNILITTSILILVNLFLYTEYKKRFFIFWTISWTLYLTRYIFALLLSSFPRSLFFLTMNQLMVMWSGFFLFYGIQTFLQKDISRYWFIAPISYSIWLVLGIYIIFFSSLSLRETLFILIIPIFIILGLTYFYTGLIFLKSEELKGVIRNLIGITFILWGFHKFYFLYFRRTSSQLLLGYFLEIFFEMIVAILIILGYFQKANLEMNRTKEKLEGSEKKYRSLFESSPFAVFLINMEGKIADCNQTAVFLFKYKRKELIGKTYRNLNIHPSDNIKNFIKRFVDLIKGNSVPPIETKLFDKSGKTHWVRIRSSLVEFGKKTYIQTIIENIEPRKKIERKLNTTETKFKTLVENAPDIILTVDEKGIIQFINRVPEGINIEDYLGTNAVNYVIKEHQQLVKDSIKKVFDTGESTQYEIKALGSQGRGTWFSTRLAPIRNEEGIESVLLITREITEQKQIEEELRKLNTIKTELLNRASHELKTPLVSIKGFSELLMKKYDSELSPYNKNFLKEIYKGSKRLEDIINDILNAAKLESGKFELKKKEHNLNEVINKVLEEFQGLITLRHHEVFISCSEDILGFFDKKQIHLVLNNLISNAIKYTPSGGNILISCYAKKESIIMSIADNGIGITEQEKERLFKRFGKIEHYGKGMDVFSEGSGLGLYISKEIVELHGGEIWVKSEGRDKGSTFFFSLPSESI